MLKINNIEMTAAFVFEISKVFIDLWIVYFFIDTQSHDISPILNEKLTILIPELFIWEFFGNFRELRRRVRPVICGCVCLCQRSKKISSR